MKSLIRTEGQSSQIANINLEGGRRGNNVVKSGLVPRDLP